MRFTATKIFSIEPIGNISFIFDNKSRRKGKRILVNDITKHHNTSMTLDDETYKALMNLMKERKSDLLTDGTNFYTHILEIYHDTEPENPRRWDNSSKMVCFHNRYNLGDKTNYSKPDFNSWNELKTLIHNNEDIAVILPLFLLDHSGISISTVDFNDRWDSGQVGYVYVTKETIRKEFGIKNITDKYKKIYIQNILNEVEVYNQYLTGEVYSFDFREKNEEFIGVQCGYYGYDLKTNGILGCIGDEEMREAILNS